MTERKEFCETCQRWLEHEVDYCPLFPDAQPPRNAGRPGVKWTDCICLLHTCYTAPKRRSRKGAPTHKDFE